MNLDQWLFPHVRPPAHCHPWGVTLEPTTGIEPVNLFLTKEVLYRLSYVGSHDVPTTGAVGKIPPGLDAMTGKEEGGTLSRRIWSGKRGSNPRHSAWKADALPTELFPLCGPAGSALIAEAFYLVEGGGFEPPKAEPTDLQSAPFGRSGTPPYREAGAGDGTRTRNLLITNQLLYRLSYASEPRLYKSTSSITPGQPCQAQVSTDGPQAIPYTIAIAPARTKLPSSRDSNQSRSTWWPRSQINNSPQNRITFPVST